MFDGQYDVSGISSSPQQLASEFFTLASTAVYSLFGFSFMSAQELSRGTTMAFRRHLADMNAGEPN